MAAAPKDNTPATPDAAKIADRPAEHGTAIAARPGVVEYVSQVHLGAHKLTVKTH